MKTTLLALALVPILLTPAFAQSIPDEINHPKYKKIWLSAKDVSDKNREEANDLNSVASGIDSTLTNVRSGIVSRRAQIVKQTDRREFLILEIPRLEAYTDLLEQEIKGLEADIRSNNIRLNQLNSKRQRTQKELNLEESILNGMLTRMAQNERQLSLTLSEINEGENQVAAFDQDNQRSEQEIRVLQDRLQNLNNELQVRSDEKFQLIELSRDLEDRISRLNKRSRKVERDIRIFSQNVERLRSIRIAAKDKLTQAELRFQKASDRAISIKQSIALNSKDAKENRAKIQNLKTRLEQAGIRMADLQTKLAQLEQQIPNLKQRLTQTNTKIENLKGKILPLQRQRKNKNDKLKIKKQELAKLKRNPDQHPAVQAKKRQLESKISTLESEIAAISRQIGPKNTQLKNLKQKAKTLNQSLSSKKQALASAKRELQTLNQSLPAWRQRLAAAKNEAKPLRNSIPTLEGQVAPLQSQVSTLTIEVANLDKEITADQTRKTRLTQQISKQKQVLAKFEQIQTPSPQDLEKIKKLKQRIAQATKRLSVVNDRLSKNIPARNKKKSKLAQVGPKLKQLKKTLSQNKNKLASLESEISNLKSKINPATQNEQKLKQKISTLKSEIPSIKTSLANARQLITRLEAEIGPLGTKLANTEQQLVKVKGRLRNLMNNPSQVTEYQSDIASLQNQISTLETAVSSIDSNLTPLKSKLSEAKAKAQELTGLLATKVAKKNKLTSEFNKLKSEVPAITQRLAKLKQKQSTLQTEKRDLLAKKTKVEQRLAQIKSRLPGLRQDLRIARENAMAERSLLKESQDLLNTILNRLSNRQNDLANSSRRLNELASIIPRLQDDLRNDRQQVATLENRIRQNDNDIAILGRQLNQLRSREQNERSSLAQITSEVNTQTPIVTNLRSIVQDLISSIDALETDNSERGSAISTRQGTIAENDWTIPNYHSQILKLKDSNIQLEQEVVSLKASIPGLIEDSTIAWTNFSNQDERARSLELLTTNKKSKFETVLALYKEQETKSILAGRDQGTTNGDKVGFTKGGEKGAVVGSNQGSDIGKNQGLLTGYAGGLTIGLVDGKNEGYENGRNAPENYERGHEKGSIQGIKDAKAFAREHSYPRGRSETKEKLLSSRPSKTIVLENSSKEKRHPDDEEFVTNLELQSLRTPEWNREDSFNKSNEEDRVQEKINELKGQISQLQTSFERALEAAGTGIQIPVEMDLKLANCARGYDLFNSLCLNSFEKAYAPAFKVSYKDNFIEKYSIAMTDSKGNSFEAFKNKRSPEGHKEAHAIAFASWDTIGALEAEAKGYSEGKTEGYESSIEGAKTAEYKLGKLAEEQFFQTNPVLRLDAASITTTEKAFFPGAVVNLNIDAINFGEIASRNGEARVELTALTGNASILTPGAISLVGFSGKTVAKIKNIATAKLGQNLEPGETVRFQAKVTFSNGKVVLREMTIKAQQHVDAALSLDYEKTPKVKGFLGYKKHTVKVKVTNKSRTRLKSGFKLKLTSNVSKVEIVEGSTQVGALERGASTTVEFVYKIRSKKLKGKKVALKVTVNFKETGLELDNQEFTVVPR